MIDGVGARNLARALAKPGQAAPVSGQAATQALGRLPKGTMNKTEEAYAGHLESRRIAGEVTWFKFEATKLRLADNTFYSPDFTVLLADGRIEQHEVKGHWQDDARVKIKVAAKLHPYAFVAVQARPGGGWSEERF